MTDWSQAAAPWWRRWLWLNLMLAAALSVCYLLGVSLQEAREWLAADGYLDRRREARGALVVVILVAVQLVALLTAYRSGGRDAGRLALAMAGLIGGAVIVLRWLEHKPLVGEGAGVTSPGAWEAWLVGYIVASHLAFALAGALGRRRPAQPAAGSLG